MSTPSPPVRPPAGAPGVRPDRSRPLPELVSELWELIRAYLVQEAVDPIKGVGRYVAYGVAGALLVGVGAVMLAIGGLRLLQNETGSALTGSLTWVPYAVVFVVLVILGVVALGAIERRSTERER